MHLSLFLMALAAPQQVATDGLAMDVVTTELPGTCTAIAEIPASFGAHAGHFMVADRGVFTNLTDDRLLTVDPATGDWTVFAAIEGDPGHLAFGDGGTWGTDLYVSGNEDPNNAALGTVYTVDAAGSMTFFGNPNPPGGYFFGSAGIAFGSPASPFGDFLYTGGSGGTPGDFVSQMPPAGSPAVLVSNIGSGIHAGAVGSVLLGPGTGGFSTDLFITVSRTGTGELGGVYTIDTAFTRTPFVTETQHPELALTVAAVFGGGPLGDFLYLAVNDEIWRVDSGGATEVVATGFGFVADLAIAGDVLYALETATSSGDARIWRLQACDFCLQAPQPGAAGQMNTLEVGGGTPSATAYLVASLATGSTAVPGCPGVTVDLAGAQLAATTTLDAAGDGTFSVAVPAAVAGRRAFLQAVTLAGCEVSNLSVWDF